MIDFISSLKVLVKPEQVHVHNFVFKLHYKFTVVMLLVSCILLSCKQLFGDPIDCDVKDESVNIINNYCWIYGTYIVKSTLKDDILSGLGLSSSVTPYWLRETDNKNSNNGIIHQKYYQWVSVVFIFQALLFYIPHYLWKIWEGGRIKLLVQDLDTRLILPNNRDVTRDHLIKFFLQEGQSYNSYALRYAFCELLNLINVLFQIFFNDWFLMGQFFTYGFDAMTYESINPLHQVFPKLTKCTYYQYGYSGTIEIRDALCILPLNIVNEKLFLVYWFWFIILAGLSFFAFVYRMLVIYLPCIRVRLLLAQTRCLPQNRARCIVEKLSFGDFFVLHLVSKNVNPYIYKEIINGVYESLNDTDFDLGAIN